MSEHGMGSIRQSFGAPDRGLRVIDGGGSGPGETTPPKASDGSPCPVVPLGHLDGIFHFLDVVGQRRSLSARELATRPGLLALFGADEAWLRANHPKRKQEKSVDEHGEESSVWRVVDIHVNNAALALQRMCFAKGLLGDQLMFRRPGIWRDAFGMPVVHCGDKVQIGGEWFSAGMQTENQVWAAAPPTIRPSAPCPVSVGRTLQEGLRALWHWRDAGSPVAALGLIANSYYGAALDWRPSGYAIGETGSGKSALVDVFRGALPLHHFDNDTTKAGVEQAVNGRAMAIVIDEAADRANRSAARDLADLLLSVSSGGGTSGSRGTNDGKGRKIELVGSIIMFSINPPDLEPQHLGRLTILETLKPEKGVDYRKEHAALARYAKSEGRALWGRALASFERYNAALPLFREGLLKIGCAPREMDQFGALLAGWWILTEEGLPTEKEVRVGLSALHGDDLTLPGLIRVASDIEADSRSRRMLHHLQATMVQLDRSTERAPIGKLVEIAWGARVEDELLLDGQPRHPDTCAKQLNNFGIRVVRPCYRVGEAKLIGGCTCLHCVDKQGRPVPRMSDEAGIWLSAQNPELRKLFTGSPFDGDRWRYELARLPSAKKSGRNVRVGSTSGHAVWLSKSDWFDDDGGGADAV